MNRHSSSFGSGEGRRSFGDKLGGLDKLRSLISFGSGKNKKMTVEDFEFKKMINETAQGKIYLAKLITDDTWYEILIMGKDHMLKKDEMKEVKSR